MEELVSQVKRDATGIQQPKQYAVDQNKTTCQQFMDFLEKGNEAQVRLEKQIGQVDQRLTQTVAHQGREVNSTVLELETKVVHYIKRANEKIDDMESRMGKMKEA